MRTAGKIGTRLLVAGFLLVLLSIGSYVDALAACPQPATTVFFVNGLNNSTTEAAESRDALAQRLGASLGGECLNFALAYNATFVPFTFDSSVVDDNVTSYRTELALGNKVILVAHSNGNVYADEAYGRMTPLERTSAGVVAVATLLDSVPGNGPYVTLVEDTLIAGIPGHLPANTTNTGGACPDVHGCHAFVEFYLNGVASGPRIVQAVSNTIPQLVRPAVVSLTLTLNQASFRPGDTIRVGLRVVNPGPARSVDFYFGQLWPDGVTVSFATSLSPLAGVTVTTRDSEEFQPLVRTISIAQGLDLTIPDVLVATLPPNFPTGQSAVFAAITIPETLDIAAPVASAPFTFTP